MYARIPQRHIPGHSCLYSRKWQVFKLNIYPYIAQWCSSLCDYAHYNISKVHGACLANFVEVLLICKENLCIVFFLKNVNSVGAETVSLSPILLKKINFYVSCKTVMSLTSLPIYFFLFIYLPYFRFRAFR